MAEVTISKGTLGALVGALVAGLVAIGFLVGRQSAPGARVPVVASPSPLTPANGLVAEAPAAGLSRASSAPAPIEGRAATAAAPTAFASPAVAPQSIPPPATPVPEIGPGAREAVARYFREIDKVQATVGGGPDPDGAARAILGQVGSGDTRALDELIDAQRKAVERLRATAVPEPCGEYHTRLIAATLVGGDIIRDMRAAMGRGELGGLQALVAKGQALQQEVRELEALRKTLSTLYGL